MCRCLTTEYAKFGRSEGHQFFSTNGWRGPESRQYNRVGSKDLNRYEQKQYFPLILNGEFVIHV